MFLLAFMISKLYKIRSAEYVLKLNLTKFSLFIKSKESVNSCPYLVEQLKAKQPEIPTEHVPIKTDNYKNVVQIF